ncbi:MAG TPA: dihydropteroate synthase [Polyangiaceae bacterium]|nr:dihydropteroate synthase [Polyangiaceae bacterium]
MARRRTTLLMGIVNVTPNSFYDGGRYEAPEAGRQRVVQLLAEGADILDIGGESSKPGAPRVAPREQLERIEAALVESLSHDAVVSIDTASPQVADAALARGAHIINDVTCLGDPELATAVARHDAYLILSHARAHQSEMAGFSEWPDGAYSDVVADVQRDLETARDAAVARGVAPDRIWFDPGIGFSKNARHSVELIARIGELVALGATLVVGASRKSFIRTLHESPAEDRLGGSIAAALWAARAGAQVLRVHDVAAHHQALAVESALAAAGGRPVARASLATTIEAMR